jgi:HK97 family phage prohead protease
MLKKLYEITSFKALPDKDGQTGRFEAIVSVFGNVDLVGDRVVKGAFKNHLNELRDIGDPIPVIWSHDWGNPFAHIGWADPKEVTEVDEGLKVIGYTDPDPFAAQVYKLMKGRRVKEFSFAYDVVKEKRASDGANDLTELRIIEVGPTLKGANPATQLLGVKSMLEEAASRKNIYEPLPGSDEEKRNNLNSAVREWADEAYPREADGEDLPRTYVGVAATFTDRVILSIETSGEDTTYVEFKYEVSEDGDVTLGEGPTDVEVEVTVTTADGADATGEASATPTDAKAGRALSAKTQRKIAAQAVQAAADELKSVLEAVTSAEQVPDSEKTSEPAGKAETESGKAEDPPQVKSLDELKAQIAALE